MGVTRTSAGAKGTLAAISALRRFADSQQMAEFPTERPRESAECPTHPQHKDTALLSYANSKVTWYTSSTVLISTLPSLLAKLSIAVLA